MRAQASSNKNQGQVWQAVQETQSKAGFEAPTSSLNDAYKDRKVQAVLEGNLEQLGLAKGEDYELRGGSALAEARGGAGEEPFDLIFMDPPYPWLRRDSRDRAPLLEAVARLREERLAEGGVLMLHVPPRELDGEELPAAGQPERRVYGRSALWYLQA